MSAASEKRKLNAIASQHSYEAGFNGRLGKYRVQMIEEAVRDLRREQRVLEIGAGEGPITDYLSQTFANVDALEPADAYFEKLSERFRARSNVRLFHGLFEATKLNETYPLVVASGVLEHVENPVDFLRKVRSHLAPGGFFVGTVPNATSLHRRIGVAMGMLTELHELTEQDHKVGHFRYYDFMTLRQDLERAEFVDVKLDGIVLKPFPNSKMDELNESYCDALFSVGRGLPEWSAEIFFSAKRGA